MKKISILITAFLAFNVSFAQDDTQKKLPMMQELFGVEKSLDYRAKY